MKPVTVAPAALAQPTAHELALSGYWTALGTGALDLRKLDALAPPGDVVLDGAGIQALDSIGARVVQKLLGRLRAEGHAVQLRAWNPQHARMLDLAAEYAGPLPAPTPEPGVVERIGRATVGLLEHSREM